MSVLDKIKGIPATEVWLTAEELEEYRPVFTVSWLTEAARVERKGPPFSVVRRQRLYNLAEVNAWLLEGTMYRTDRFGERRQ